jgi:two-component system OmpR family response regulator
VENKTRLSFADSAKAPRHCEINPAHRILVVDDEDEIRRINTIILRDAGYNVESATDGAAAWDALQLNHYDLLLTDNNMPKMTGLELIENLHAAHIRLPVIMVTGNLPPHTPGQATLIEAVLLKPYSADELLARVRNVLQATESDAKSNMSPPSETANIGNGLRL